MIIIKYYKGHKKQFTQEIITERKLKIMSDHIFNMENPLSCSIYYYVNKCLKHQFPSIWKISNNITKSLKNNKEIKIFFSIWIYNSTENIKDYSAFILSNQKMFSVSGLNYLVVSEQNRMNKFLSYVNNMRI